MIDPNKKYQTRNGRPVTLLHRAPEGWSNPFPWRGAIGENNTATWTDAGKYSTAGMDANLDLIEVREPLETELVIDNNKIYGFAGGRTADWYDHQRPAAAPHRIATFKEELP